MSNIHESIGDYLREITKIQKAQNIKENHKKLRIAALRLKVRRLSEIIQKSFYA